MDSLKWWLFEIILYWTSIFVYLGGLRPQTTNKAIIDRLWISQAHSRTVLESWIISNVKTSISMLSLSWSSRCSIILIFVIGRTVMIIHLMLFFIKRLKIVMAKYMSHFYHFYCLIFSFWRQFKGQIMIVLLWCDRTQL